MKNKYIRIITILLTICFIFSGCGTPIRDKQINFIKRSENTLLNKKYETILTDKAKIKGLIYYKNYVKSLNNKPAEITNIGTFVFKTLKTANKFKKTFEGELKDTIKKLQSQSNVGTFRQEKLEENQTLYTSIFKQEKECSTVLVSLATDINAVVVITGVSSKLEKGITQSLKKKSTNLLETLYEGKFIRKRDYIKRREREILNASQKVFKGEGYNISLEPKSDKNSYSIKLSADKKDKKNNGEYFATIYIESNSKTIIREYSKNNVEKDLKSDKYQKLIKEKLDDKNYQGFVYSTKANNGYMSSLIVKDNNNHILIKLDYRQYKKINNNDPYKKLKNIYEKLI